MISTLSTWSLTAAAASMPARLPPTTTARVDIRDVRGTWGGRCGDSLMRGR
jgi:hypothetical protein